MTETDAPRIIHAATHGTGICPRCGIRIIDDHRPNVWIGAGPNCVLLEVANRDGDTER